MIAYALLQLGLALAYIVLLHWLRTTWKGIPVFQLRDFDGSHPFISVVVAARNEAENIEACLHALLKQDYPRDRYEIIVVDDHSMDETATLAAAFDIRLHALADGSSTSTPAKEGKKAALTHGIAIAHGTYIATTDADCVVPPRWLTHLAACMQTSAARCVTAPVVFKSHGSWIETFQVLDLMGLMGLTAVGIDRRRYFMANGANMCFSKTAFHEVGGYSGNEEWASGDDMFLIEKWSLLDASRIAFLKSTSAIVYTEAERTWRTFIRQRIRWATKTRGYHHRGLQWIISLPFLLSLTILANLLLGLWWYAPLLMLGVIGLFLKSMADYAYLRTMGRFFKTEVSFTAFLVSALLHPMYLVGIGLAGLVVRKYSWKGRRVR